MVLVRVVDGSKSGVVEVWEMALDGVVGRRRVLACEGCGRSVRGVIQSDRLCLHTFFPKKTLGA